MNSGTKETHLCETLRPPPPMVNRTPPSNRLGCRNPETMANGSRQGPCGAALALANACRNPRGACRHFRGACRIPRGTCRICWGDLQVICGGFVGQPGGLPDTIRPLFWGAFFRDVSRFSPSDTILRTLFGHYFWATNFPQISCEFPTNVPQIPHTFPQMSHNFPQISHNVPQIPKQLHTHAQEGCNSCAASRLPSPGGGSTKSPNRSPTATDGTRI